MVIVIDRSHTKLARRIVRRVTGRYLFRMSRHVYISGRKSILKHLIAELESQCRKDGVNLIVANGKPNADLGFEIGVFTELGYQGQSSGYLLDLLHNRALARTSGIDSAATPKNTGQPDSKDDW